MTGEGPERILDVDVRAMTLDDVPRVVAIEMSVFASPWSGDTFTSLLDRSGSGAELWVLEEKEDGVIGYAVLWCILDQGELANIAIEPDYRSRGLAARLLSHALQSAKERGVESVFLEVRESNERAAALYRGFGFEEVGVRRGYYDRPREDAHVMKLRL